MIIPVTKKTSRFRLLDGMRFLAALAVLMYHYVAIDRGQWAIPATEKFQFASKIAAYGALGVPLFFLISGFVILMSAWGRSIPEFVASRISRLYPSYWAAVLATTFLLVIVTKGSMKSVTFDQVAVNLTMLQSAFDVKHVDGVYWTLFIEFMFYILIALIISRGMTEAKIQAFIFLWPLIGIIASNSGIKIADVILVPNYSALFAGGMAIYLVHAFGSSFIRWLLIAYTLIISMHQTTSHFFAHDMVNATGQELSPTVCNILIVLMFVAIALITLSPIKSVGHPIFSFLGALTYPLYLIHEYWGWWIIGSLSANLNKWLVLLLSTLLVLIFAMLIERFVERPLHPKIRRAILKNAMQIRSAEKDSLKVNSAVGIK